MSLIRERVIAYGAAAWGQSRAFRDADIDRIMARVIPVVQAGQVQAAQVTNAYIGRLAVLAGVRWTSGIDREAIVNYRGVPAEEVYRRPAVATYSALAKGAMYVDAVQVGAARLVGILATDLQQASNRQASAAIGGSGFSGFRRQLSGSENCAFCVIASTQRYLKGDLLPLHPACDCETMPLLSATDPGQVIDQRLLDSTHAAIDKQLGFTDRGARDLGVGKVSSKGKPISDYTDLIVVNQHSELGPILGWRGAKFTGVEDLHSH